MINIGKCKCLHIGSCNPCWKYKMSWRSLEDVEEEKDLGVIIDKDLKFRRQAAAAIKKATSSLGLIKKSFTFLDEKTLPFLFKAQVRTHLEYGNVIWGPFYKGDAKDVERVQRTALGQLWQYRELVLWHRRKDYANLSCLRYNIGGEGVTWFGLTRSSPVKSTWTRRNS